METCAGCLSTGHGSRVFPAQEGPIPANIHCPPKVSFFKKTHKEIQQNPQSFKLWQQVRYYHQAKVGGELPRKLYLNSVSRCVKTRREEYNIHEQRRAEPLTPYALPRSTCRCLSRFGSRLPPGLPFGFFLVFSCWARLTGQRAWIKYEGHPFNPFLCSNLNQREDGRQKQQRYSKRSGCGRGSHRPAHALGQMLPRCRHLEKKTSARLPPTEGHRNTAQERSQRCQRQTEHGGSRNGSPGYTWGHQAGSTGGRSGLH